MSHIRHMLHNLLINAAFIMLPHMSHIHTLLINAAFRMLPVDVSHVDETHACVMWHTSTKLMHMWCGTRPRNSCICDDETHAYVMWLCLTSTGSIMNAARRWKSCICGVAALMSFVDVDKLIHMWCGRVHKWRHNAAFICLVDTSRHLWRQCVHSSRRQGASICDGSN